MCLLNKTNDSRHRGLVKLFEFLFQTQIDHLLLWSSVAAGSSNCSHCLTSSLLPLYTEYKAKHKRRR